jgi:hypothetical protein
MAFILVAALSGAQAPPNDEIAAAPTAKRELIELVGGNSVSGRVIKEDDEKLFVDIGLTIIQIPLNSVISRRQISATGEELERPDVETIYQIGPGIPLPLQEAESLPDVLLSGCWRGAVSVVVSSSVMMDW